MSRNTHEVIRIALFALVLAMLAFVMVAFAAVDTGLAAELYQSYTLELAPDNSALRPLMCNSGNSCNLTVNSDGWINVQLDRTGQIEGKTVECGNYSCASVRVTKGQTIVVMGSPVIYANLTLTPRFNSWATNQLYLATISR